MINARPAERSSKELVYCFVPVFQTGARPMLFFIVLLLILLIITCSFLLKNRKARQLAQTKAEKIKQQQIDQSLIYQRYISHLGNQLRQFMIDVPPSQNDILSLSDQFSGLQWYNELIQSIHQKKTPTPSVEKTEVRTLIEKITLKAFHLDRQSRKLAWKLRSQAISARLDIPNFELILLNLFNGICLEAPGRIAEIVLELRPNESKAATSVKNKQSIELSITVQHHSVPNQINNELRKNKSEEAVFQLLLPIIAQALEQAGGQLVIKQSEQTQSIYLLTFPAADIEINKAKRNLSFEEDKQADKFTLFEKENQQEPIMIVSDSEDERLLLISLLTPYFECLAPHEAEQTMALLKGERLPMLLITTPTATDDQGQNLTASIRQTRGTSHLPVLVLAEHADPELISKYYLQGADGILLPPLNQQVLIAQISRTIKNRELSENSQPRELLMTDLLTNKVSRDELFIQQLKSLIKQHLDQADFNVHELSLEMELSTTQLYRKIKNLTGFSPVELIRNTRLEHAHQLLSRKNYSIKEVCYQSGFNNLSYFVKCFREYYGVTPASYRDTSEQ
ncbi:helix-turn-helix domain-containing protein [Roseimarinus sediminis]|uniref:helix-turn-helix domain-containing protein n=1 Tax=Roseimarinus sediminis TaxID=1610899 RepID=UPI003D1A5945